MNMENGMKPFYMSVIGKTEDICVRGKRFTLVLMEIFYTWKVASIWTALPKRVVGVRMLKTFKKWMNE